MKQRFSALDVRAEVACLAQKLVGLRLANIYDLNNKTRYLFKFAAAGQKCLLLVESGIRLHTTSYARDHASGLPTGFTAKLRKHLRTRRLTSVTQHGLDRSVDFCFGQGEHALHLVVEFYAAGNVILTDAAYTTLALLRPVGTAGPQDAQSAARPRLQVGDRYVTSGDAVPGPVTRADLANLLETAAPAASLRKFLREKFAVSHTAPLVDHILTEADLAGGSLSVGGFISAGPAALDCLFAAFQRADEFLGSLKGAKPPIGVVSVEPARPGDESDAADRPYVSVFPFVPANVAAVDQRTFDSFDRALDEYFARAESARLVAKVAQMHDAVHRKIDKIRDSQASQIQTLLAVRENAWERAQAIEANAGLVEQILLTVRQLLAAGLDWTDIEQLTLEEQAAGNMVALCIAKFDLAHGQVTCRLPSLAAGDDTADDESVEEDFSSNLEQEDAAAGEILVDLVIYSSAHANARQYYDQRRQAAAKQERTEATAVKVLRAAQKRVDADVAKLANAVGPPSSARGTVFARLRTPFWFEKYLWFISNEGHLVLGARDAVQTAQLVGPLLRPHDIVVHADLDGAAVVLVRNSAHCTSEPVPSAIPPNTLQQAGALAVCTSQAWANKTVASAYWVRAAQVAHSVHGISVSGDKNWMPPVQLAFGVGLVLFLDSDNPATVENHPPGAEWVPAARFGAQPADEPGSADQAAVDLERAAARYGLGAGLPEASSGDMVALVDTMDSLQLHSVPSPPASLQKKQRRADSSQKKPKSGSRTKNAAEKGQQRNDGQDEAEAKSSAPPAGSKPAHQIRGKRGKLKKARQKYRHQDDEDRQLMMHLLGHRSSDAAEPNAASEDQSGASSTSHASKANSDSEAADLGGNRGEEAPMGAAPDADQDSVSVKSSEPDAEPIQAPKPSQTAIAEQPDPALDSIAFLDTITAAPKARDSIIAAIPMVAPWSALMRFPHKVKLLPGSLKKGKATKAVVHHFVSHLQHELQPLAKQLAEMQRAGAPEDSISPVRDSVQLLEALRECARAISPDALVLHMLQKTRIVTKYAIDGVPNRKK